jgi:hypothetical protein
MEVLLLVALAIYVMAKLGFAKSLTFIYVETLCFGMIAMGTVLATIIVYLAGAYAWQPHIFFYPWWKNVSIDSSPLVFATGTLLLAPLDIIYLLLRTIFSSVWVTLLMLPIFWLCVRLNISMFSAFKNDGAVFDKWSWGEAKRTHSNWAPYKPKQPPFSPYNEDGYFVGYKNLGDDVLYNRWRQENGLN